MFCTECGKKIDDEVSMCPYCGTSVYDETEAENENELGGENEVPEPDGEDSAPELDRENEVPEPDGEDSAPELDRENEAPELDGEDRDDNGDEVDEEPDASKKRRKKSADKKKSRAGLIWILAILLIVVLLVGICIGFSQWHKDEGGFSTSNAQKQVLDTIQSTIEYNKNVDDMEYERAVVRCIMEQISVSTISDNDAEAVLEIEYPDAAALLRKLIAENPNCSDKRELYQLMRDELKSGKAELVKANVTVVYGDSEDIVMDEILVNVLTGGLYVVDSEMEEQP